jgi:hypothetical protein
LPEQAEVASASEAIVTSATKDRLPFRRQKAVRLAQDGRSDFGHIGGGNTAKTTMLVVGAEGFAAAGDISRGRSQKLIRAEELNAQQPAAPIQILSEDQFCRLAGVSSPDAIRRQYYATRDLLARYRSLRDDHMRYLVKCGSSGPSCTQRRYVFAFFRSGRHQASE